MNNNEMNIRTPQPSQQAKIMRSVLAAQGINIRHTLALEAVAQMSGFANTHVMCAHAPEDTELAKFMQGNKDGQATAADDMLDVREKLAQMPSFRADNFPCIDFEQYLAPLKRGADVYGGFTFTVFFETETEKNRAAPFGIVTKRINTPNEGWTDRPLPASLETVAALQLKLLVKNLAANGVNLTEVYDESPTHLQ